MDERERWRRRPLVIGSTEVSKPKIKNKMDSLEILKSVQSLFNSGIIGLSDHTAQDKLNYNMLKKEITRYVAENDGMVMYSVVLTDRDNAHEPKVLYVQAPPDTGEDLILRAALEALDYKEEEIVQYISGEYTDDDFEASMEQKSHNILKVSDPIRIGK